MSFKPSASHAAPRRSALAGFLGSAIEYYDFVAYGTAAALVFDEIFFSSLGSGAGTLAAVGTFGVGYVARPIGSIIIGHYGDRVGRRRVLLFTLLLMGAATFLIGVLPGYGTIGIAAPILLIVLRLCQGVSAAGEQAGSSSLSMENAPAGKRALYSSWTMAGTQFGTILGTLAFIPVMAMPSQAMLAWGWRIPFLISGVFVGVVFFVRRGVPEPEVFVDSRVKRRTGQFPVLELLRNHWRNMIRVMLCSLLAAVGTVMNVFGLSYATDTVGIAADSMLAVTVVTGLSGVVVIPLWALLSDRVGRKPLFVVGMVAAAVLIFPYFYFISTGNLGLIVLGGLLMSVFASAGASLQPAFYAEMFETGVRYSGVAISTQFGYVLAGFTPAIGYAIVQPGPNGWIPVAVLASVCCVISAGSALTARETRSVALDDLGHSHPAQQEPEPEPEQLRAENVSSTGS